MSDDGRRDEGAGEPEDTVVEILGFEGEEPSTDSESAAAPAPGASAAELAAERERYLRLRADFDNFRKRSERDRAEVERYALAEAVRRVDGARVALLGSGGMSHRFWPLSAIRKHFGFDPAHVISKAARDMDQRILELWARGDHQAVLDLYPEYEAQHHPEGRFAHYLMALGAMGGPECRARGERLSEYENAVGTGQVHVFFRIESP